MDIGEKTKQILLKIGFNPATKGFRYICDAIALLDEADGNGKTIGLYNAIAKKNNDTYSRVERAIKHAFDSVIEKGSNLNMVNKYLTTVYTSNSALLHTLWINIQEEIKEEQSGLNHNTDRCETETITINKQVLKSVINMLEKELENYGN